MSKAQDPFYIVKEEIQESIDKLQSSFHQWERIRPENEQRVRLTKELFTNCKSIEWQVGNVKKAVVAGKENGNSASAMHRELMRLPDRSNRYTVEDNDDFISSESDRQMLLIRQQDEELDELSASVERIGGVGLTIHEELLAQKKVAMVMKTASATGKVDELDKAISVAARDPSLYGIDEVELENRRRWTSSARTQEKIIDDLGNEMDSTTNRLDFVQVILST
ncbi:hypothetical protein GOBAR_AA40109 [Gossypium barbadense]|uniref:Syntaxin 6/10/61 N-terminal domain-containing protein n=1 Tax=Gossypium barbadense TaxID=3634 RepID=A0A2P5VP47_GOSBA|nr:hypothetical protein GOBAR_AA40109 [Gossypium barbadense]